MPYNIIPLEVTIAAQRPWLIAACAYLLGALAFLWPMPGHMSTAIWGDRFDAWTTLWLIDHLGERIAEWNWTSTTTDILYPLGYNLWSFGHMALQLIGGVLVAIGVPLVVSYNLLLILGIWTSALGAHCLGWELTRNHTAAAVSGVVFATSPYLYAEAGAGCIELVAAGLLPLHATTLIRLIRKPSTRRFWVTTACLAIIGPFNWYYTLFAGMLTVGLVIWQIIAMRRRPGSLHRRRVIQLIGASVLVAALINLPLITEARRETPDRPSISAELFSSEEAFAEVRSVSNGSKHLDTLDEALLQRVDAMQVHFNSTSVQSLIRADFEFNPLNSTPGRLAYAVGLFGLIIAGRKALGWSIIAAAATVLSLGPFLNVSGALMLEEAATRWPLPYYWAHEYLPFFSKAYRPYRIGVVALTSLAAVGAIGGAALFRSGALRWPPLWVSALGILGFLQPHWSGERPAERPLADAGIASIYTELSALEEGGVIEVPLHYQPVSNANARTQYAQTVHGHPLLNTNQLIRWPDLLRFKEFVSSHATLDTLVDLGRKQPPHAVAGSDTARLVTEGFRWVVAHKRVPADEVELTGESGHTDLLGPAAWILLDNAFGEPVIANGDSVVYDLTRAPGDDVEVNGEDIAPLDLPFDPITTGFPLVLTPGQHIEIYSGQAQAFHAWIHPVRPESQISLRVEDAGIVREHPLETEPGHWRYISIALSSPDGATLSLVGRGDEAAHIEITAASVSL